METLAFLMGALIMHNNKGAAMSLCFAAFVDFFGDVLAIVIIGSGAAAYAYYVASFLLVFAWWMLLCRLKLVGGQIVAGLFCVLISLSVVDCYASNGYETLISIIFPYAITVLNIAIFWAAWNDRNWSYTSSRSGRVESVSENNKADFIC